METLTRSGGRETVEAELFRILVENTADIIVRGDAGSLIRTYVSPSYTEVLGYSQDEMLGGHGVDHVHPDDVRQVRAELGKLGPACTTARCTFRMRRKDGGYIWLEGRYRYVESDRGILGVLRDVSERKEAEARLDRANVELRSANAILAATLEHMNQGVCFFDGDHKLILCNRRYAELYHLSPDLTQPGTTLSSLVKSRYARGASPEMASEDYLRWRSELNAKGKPFDSEVTLRNGRVMLISHHPMDGGGWVATHDDITERRRTEEMLSQVQKLRSLGTLTAGIAHDFNNLLQTVGTALEMVGNEEAVTMDSPLLELVRDARIAVASGGELTHQLLSFSGKQFLRPEFLDIGEQVTAMGELLRQACGDRTTLEIVTGEGPFPTFADPSQFRAALMNLVTNARDASRAGDRLTIAVEKVAEPADQAAGEPAACGGSIRVQVRDNGHGIAPENLALVFDPFFTTKPFGVGSGLGLAQVHGFALQSGGSVSVASKPGAGTTVTLLLPRAAPAGAA